MDKAFEKEFNELIVETFHLVLKEEMKFIKSLTNSDLSSREVHVIEYVGKNNGKVTITDIAEAMQITLASITVMVNKLEEKGLLVKKKDEKDGRSVLISITAEGKKIDKCHSEFHSKTVKKIAGGLTDFEKEVLAGGVKKLNGFFKIEN